MVPPRRLDLNITTAIAVKVEDNRLPRKLDKPCVFYHGKVNAQGKPRLQVRQNFLNGLVNLIDILFAIDGV